MATLLNTDPISPDTPHSHNIQSTKQLLQPITNIDANSTQEQILHELRQINQIQAEIAAEAPLKAQALYNFLVQLFGLVVGTLFGVFAVLGWKVAVHSTEQASAANDFASSANQLASTANDFARAANQLALVAYCQAQAQSQSNVLCSMIQAAAAESVYGYASALYGITSLPSPSTTSTSHQTSRVGTAAPQPTPTESAIPPPSTSSGKHVQDVVVVAVTTAVFGIILVGLAAYLQAKRYLRMRGRRQLITGLASEREAKSE